MTNSFPRSIFLQSNWIRNAGLWAYYIVSQPWRRHARQRDYLEHTAPVMILFYHRVADQDLNAWTMTKRKFQAQMDWLRHNCDLVSLEEGQRRIRQGNQRPCVTITFDDGYGDNCHFALPYLIKHRIPCTYFVTVSNVFEGRPFPHDIACGRPLRPNSPEEILALSEAGIDIGVHAMNHIDFGPLVDKVHLHNEIVVSRDILTKHLGRQPRYFAFPYGLHHNLNRDAFQMARDHGYAGVCSAYGAYNLPEGDPFHLQRIHGDPDRCRFLNWMTVDPRKRTLGSDYDFTTSLAQRAPLDEVLL